MKLLFFLVFLAKCSLDSVKLEDLKWVLPHQERFYCQGGVGKLADIELNSENYVATLKKHSKAVLFITSSSCEHCCQYKEELSALKARIRANQGGNIVFLELNTETDLEVLKENKIHLWKLPSLYFVDRFTFTQYNSLISRDSILNWLNSLLNPVVLLETVEEVELFLDSKAKFKENTDFKVETASEHELQIRMVGFFGDLKEFETELDLFKEYADKVKYRSELRVGLVKDRDIVEHFKNTRRDWFYSNSSIVVSRNNEFTHLDLGIYSEEQEEFMFYNTLPYLDEFSSNNSKLVSSITTPLVFLFIDTVYFRESFNSHFKMLQRLALKFQGKYVFLYVDGNARTEAKRKLGLEKEAPSNSNQIPHSSD